ncbi:MAG: DUF72 domain-containing protein [Raineya sp.]
MDFGKLSDISQVNFSLPAESKENRRVLPQKPTEKPKIYVGCPIWSQKEWIGKIYPHNAQNKDFLHYYAKQFNAIELNTTHYRIPDKKTIEQWKKQVDGDFHFSPKFPQPISHEKMLLNAQDLLNEFCEAIRGLDENLGLSFLQLPPHFEIKHLNNLEHFLEHLPKDIPLAVEFRHASWFKGNNFEQAAKALEEYQIATVITDVAGRRDVLHQRLTTPKVLIRFVGNALHATDYTRIDAWIEQIYVWLQQGLETLYFFLHEPDNILAPDIASYFIEKLIAKTGISLKTPTISKPVIQMKLF